MAIDDSTAHKITENQFSIAWGAETAIRFDNVPFTQASLDEFVHVTPQPMRADFIGITQDDLVRIWTDEGIAAVGIYVRTDTGDGRWYEIIDLAAAVFRQKRFTDSPYEMLFEEPSMMRNPRLLDNAWFGGFMAVKFQLKRRG